MTLPVRVAVLGSCVSRDLFNRTFNPHYKDLFDCVTLSNQVSLISLMDEAVPIPDESISDLDAYAQGEVRREASRAFLEDLVAQRPEYLLLDLFADVHFGCFSVDGRYLSRNRWKILNTRFYAEADKVDLVPEEDRDAYLAVWADALDRLLGFLRAELPDTRIVLHRARNVTSSVTPDGSVRPLGRERQLVAMNEWWDRLDEEVLARGVERVLDLFSADQTSTDAHPWGPFAVHYTLDYHPAALSALTRIVLDDARAAAQACRTTAPAGRTRSWPRRPWGSLRRPVLDVGRRSVR